MSAAILALVKRHWPALAAGIVAVLVLWGAYSFGASATAERYERKIADQAKAAADAMTEALRVQAEQSKANLAAAVAIERAHIIAQQAGQAFFNSLSEQVATYVEQTPTVRSCGLDADGLRIWTDANRGPAHRAPGAHP